MFIMCWCVYNITCTGLFICLIAINKEIYLYLFMSFFIHLFLSTILFVKFCFTYYYHMRKIIIHNLSNVNYKNNILCLFFLLNNIIILIEYVCFYNIFLNNIIHLFLLCCSQCTLVMSMGYFLYLIKF